MHVSRRSRRRRGEGQVEYAIIAMVIATCSVVSLIVAGSGGLRRVASANKLCMIENGECDRIGDEDYGDEGLPVPGNGEADGEADDEAGAGATHGGMTHGGSSTGGKSINDSLAGSGDVEQGGEHGSTRETAPTGSEPQGGGDEIADLDPLTLPPPRRRSTPSASARWRRAI